MSEQTATVRAKRPGKDYGYCNARARGMRSRLFTRAFLDGLMEAQDVKRVIQMLQDTEYALDIDTEIIHGKTFQSIDEALKGNMVRTFQKVIGFSNDQAGLLLTTLLGRWDLFNLKTIIRGKHLNLSSDEIIVSLMPLASFNETDLAVLTREPDVRAVVDTLGTWGVEYAAPLREAVGEYMQTLDLSLLELSLDRYYAVSAAKRLLGRGQNYQVARRVLGAQIDSTNLLTVFRLLKADMQDIDPGRFFLSGGLDVDETLFRTLAAMSDVDEVLDRVKSTPYGKPLEDVVLTYIEDGSISVFERALEEFVTRRAFAAGRGDPLGVGILIGYLWAKQNEVTNLRIIVKGISVGMPVERMRKELIFV
jgi:V/A-type H+-transporting ATPase subunit C